jgi:hypothetical protein
MLLKFDIEINLDILQDFYDVRVTHTEIFLKNFKGKGEFHPKYFVTT